MTRSAFRFAIFLGLLMAAAPADGAEGDAPLPRFASLRSNEVNLRAGPGSQYPVEWVFLRRSLPIEITAEYGHWRKVRDVDGSEGWVHKSLLTGRRSILVTGAVRTLRREPDGAASALAKLAPGVVARLLACNEGWCRVSIEGLKGWLPQDNFWGAYHYEVLE